MTLRVHTVGHSRRCFDELQGLLTAHGIQTLVDIRRVPRSRMNPQFNRERLQEALPAVGLGYLHIEALGGLREPTETSRSPNAGWKVTAFRNYADYALTQAFATAFSRLLDRAARESCAIMCAEADWRQCHRRIVTDYLLAHAAEVVHILDAQRTESASLTPFATLRGDRSIVYAPPVPAQAELPL